MLNNVSERGGMIKCGAYAGRCCIVLAIGECLLLSLHCTSSSGAFYHAAPSRDIVKQGNFRFEAVYSLANMAVVVDLAG